MNSTLKQLIDEKGQKMTTVVSENVRTLSTLTSIKINDVTKAANTATTSEKSTDLSEAGLSPVLFLFCALLVIVAIMLIAKIVLKSKNSSGGFWTSRSPIQSGGRLGLGGGPALGIPNGDISFGGGSAIYTAMPTHANVTHTNEIVSEGAIRDTRLDWERQFFENADDDDEERLTTNMEMDPASCSKLQLK